MASHRKHAQASAVVVAGATAGMTAVLTFGYVADALAATLPGSYAVVGVGGKDDTLSARIPNKFDGNYVPYNGEFAGPAADRYYPVHYSATLPIDSSVATGRAPLIAQVAEARTAVGPDGTIYIVSYSEGTIVAEKYKRELTAGTAPPPGGNVEFVYIAAPTVPNGGIYARFPNTGPLALLGFTSTGAAAPTAYDQTFITVEYDPVGDFPAYANPLSLANAAAGFIYLHGDPTPDATDLNDPDAIIVTPVDKEGGGTDTYILVKTEHLPLLQPFRDFSTALNATAYTEPVLGAIEPTLRLGVDMGYTDRDYSDPATPTRFSLITPPKRIIETVNALPGAIQEGAENFNGGSPSPASPSTTSGPTDRNTLKKKAPKVVAPTDAADAPDKPVKRNPAHRRDDVRNAMSDLAKNVKDTLKPRKPKPDAKPASESDTDKAA
ncbi:PE-PPE domain-containing protein [Mycolicibacterium neworleansense]|uniref:PE-PPE-like protein n=1 Tax=Mycolicibacterium neworleansense TaxID=146018 RepID=A0A0H5S8M0_9MYCO|nr:PE-PPE domain-containing protein [Mycolicibacterium neworleansense]MCV7362902.1 PE-PPE domain-containing protein [Mycolicibacterium neworleansense]CRZ17649.1 PE-PPE-like protein [Mycolicibacterium neworleansense]